MRPLALFLALGLSAALAIAGPASADDPGPDAIVKRAIQRDAIGLEGGHATVTMTITRDDGVSESKTFEIWSRKSDGLLRTVVRFKAPAKLAGTAFLLVQKAGQPDEQWIWLPAFKKARKITTKERSTPFAGSDFTYADLERRDLKDATYAKLPDEPIGKDACHVIAATPKSAGPYAKVTSWLRKSDDVPLRTQFFDASGKLEKTLFARKIKTIDGHVVVTESRLERAGGPRATELRVDAISFESAAPESFFTVAALEGGA